MPDTTSSAAAVLVRDRAGRRQVNRITVEAYLWDAQRHRDTEARKTEELARRVSGWDRALILPYIVISTWMASRMGTVYLLRSGKVTVRLNPGLQIGAIVWTMVLPLMAPGVAILVVFFFAPSMLVALAFLAYLAVLALLLIGQVLSTVTYRTWMRPLRPKKAWASFQGERPAWIVSDLASVHEGSPIDLVAEIIATINGVVPHGAKVGAKARNERYFRAYSRYLTPVGKNNLALTGTVPLQMRAAAGPQETHFPVSSTSSELERRK